jgi:hypothetical protein
MKTFKEFLAEQNLKPGDGVRTSDGTDGIIHTVLSGGDLAIVITGWDYFGDDNQSKRPSTSIENMSDLSKKNVDSRLKEYYKQAKNIKL